jgi:hypothetical protein
MNNIDYRSFKIFKLSFYVLNILFFSKKKIFKPSPKKILIINGADPFLKNNAGVSPKDINSDLIKILMNN